MLNLLLQVAVVLLPALWGIGMELFPPKSRKSKLWRPLVIGFGIALSFLVWFQIFYSNKQSIKDREMAIRETSQQVAAQTSKDVTRSVTSVYTKIVASQNDQIQKLQGQLSAQSKKVDVISKSNIVTGKEPIAVRVTNPSPTNPPYPPTPLPDLSWTQKPGEPEKGKATVVVSFRVSDNLVFPAFLAVCDGPCKTLRGACTPMSQASFLGASVPNVAGIIFNMPRPLPDDSSCSISLVSASAKPITVTLFRILKKSELPITLR